MTTLAKRLCAAALASVAFWTWTPGSLQAQGVNPLTLQPGYNPALVGPVGPPLNAAAFNPNPGLFNYGPQFGGARLTSVNSGFQPYANLNNSFNNPYVNPNYWPGYYPFGDFGLGQTLYGTAAVINSQGQFLMQNQQAKLIQQQAAQERLDTRRKIFDQWLYEQANNPSLQEQRDRVQRLELRRAMNNPPLTEIINGNSLNTLLKDLLAKQTAWAKGPNQAIDESILKHLNLSTQNGANVALLKRVKDAEQLPWPAALKLDAYKNEVGRINKNITEAVKLVEAGRPVDAGTVQNIRDDVQKLQAQLTDNINDLTPADCIAAKRFLNQIDEALMALKQADIAEYLSGRFAAKTKTVQELLQFMASRGLNFGPAVAGDEAAYPAIHNYLVGFNTALGKDVAADAPPMP